MRACIIITLKFPQSQGTVGHGKVDLLPWHRPGGDRDLPSKVGLRFDRGLVPRNPKP